MYLIEEWNDKFEIMFLHFNPYPYVSENIIKEYYKRKSIVKAEYWSVEESKKINMGSGAGYI
jgi:hypothetical protein